MQEILVSELKRYSLADVVKGCDLIEGKEYESFVQSVKSFGVISPIIVTPENVVISGWTRVRACKDLGLEFIPAIIQEFESLEDEIIAMCDCNLSRNN